ncbi:MAG: NADAR family protein [Cytophagales bacterium]|nr:NADAR family protein [Armatimonadota bacterium]
MGRDRSRPLRPDWGEVKEDAMRRALAAKFAAHPDLRVLLLSTGSEEIVENAPGDFYWGAGRDGTGKNRLGALLMELRAALQTGG